jgi:NAD(P)-dependent dehydrogenase (short-subunit alcohol dehydrogenase family)
MYDTWVRYEYQVRVLSLGNTLANELAEYRIRVNTIHPHGVQTDLRVPELFIQIEQPAPDLGVMYVGALPDQTSTTYKTSRPRRPGSPRTRPATSLVSSCRSIWAAPTDDILPIPIGEGM